MRIVSCVAIILLSMGGASRACASAPERAWLEYHQQQSAVPLRYEFQDQAAFDGGTRRRYTLHSQHWPDAAAADGSWSHRVEVLTPDHPQPGPALLVINNGIAGGGEGSSTQAADDFPPELLERLSRRLGMAVVSIADVPDQPRRVPGDDRARLEDDLVALTWRRFLDDPQGAVHLPLHLPMAQAAVRAMDLAARELPAALRPSFVVTGASKRAWAAWLLPLVDDRVSHLVPFVMDMHWQALAPHIRRTYGQRWPIALHPYWHHGITEWIADPAFAALMQGSDPYMYLSGPLRDRLGLPKYLVNASGDDFFTPDSTRFYLDALPGATTLRMVPNTGHRGIREHMASSLLPVLRRWRRGGSLPQVSTGWRAGTGGGTLQIRSSEMPVEAVLWTARNARDRDFRHACAIAYVPQALALADRDTWNVALEAPPEGWQASFVALRYSDGVVATTPVRVLPDPYFPSHPPSAGSGGCALVEEPPIKESPVKGARIGDLLQAGALPSGR